MQALLADLKEPFESQEYRLKVGAAPCQLDSTTLLGEILLVAILSTILKRWTARWSSCWAARRLPNRALATMNVRNWHKRQGIWSVSNSIGWPSIKRHVQPAAIHVREIIATEPM